MKVFIDANVLIDIVVEREAFYKSAFNFISLCLERNIEMVTNSVCIANTYYIGYKLIRDKDVLHKKLENLTDICPIVLMDHNQVKSTLRNSYSDFEDALHNTCAIVANCSHIVTRDKSGFSHSAMNIMTPKEYLNLYL